MSTSKSPAWLELIQLVPVVSLALPFIVSGDVDLSHAGAGMLVAAVLTVPVSLVVLARKGTLNPILLGTALWLWVGAAGFNLPLSALRGWLVEAQGFGLFVGVLVVGLITTFGSAQGFIGCRTDDRGFVQRSSLALLALGAIALAWSWFFRHNIRLGGGLPFIVLNVTRRVITVQAARRGLTR